MDETGDSDALLLIDASRRLEELNHVLLGNLAALLLESLSYGRCSGELHCQELLQRLLYRALQDLFNLDHHRVRVLASKLLFLLFLLAFLRAALGGFLGGRRCRLLAGGSGTHLYSAPIR